MRLLKGMQGVKANALRVAAGVLCLVLVSACEGPSKQIIGRWQSVDAANPMVWEFSRNGGVMVGSEPGRYSFGDGNRIKVQTRIATFVYEVDFTEDRMVWKQANGSKTEFQRAK